MAFADTDIYTVEITVWDGAAETTLRFSAAGPSGFTTGASDTPALTAYLPLILEPALVERTAFSAQTTSGESRASVGNVVIRNNLGQLDAYRAYGFDGRRIVIRRGASGAAYPSAFTTLLDATMNAPIWDYDKLTLTIRDTQKYTHVPLQTTLYAGSGALEGTAADLKGKPKPVLYGVAKNIPAPCVNATKLIYQIADSEIHSVDDVRDRGLSLSTSLDWNRRTHPFTGGDDWIYGAAYGASIYVVVGVNSGSGAGIAGSSPDGVTWTSRTLTGFGTARCNDVAFGDSTFVAVGEDAVISTSTNGTSWTNRVAAGADHLNAVAYSSTLDLWAAVGTDFVNGLVRTSPDGTSWTTRTSSTTQQLLDVAWGSGLFVAVGYAGTIMTSLDGVTWTSRATQFSAATFSSVGYSSSVGWMAVGWDSGGGPGIGGTAVAASSVDGITWIRQDMPYGPLAVIDGASNLMAVTGAKLMSTVDGISWTTNSSAFKNSAASSAGMGVQKILHGNSDYLVVGHDGTDGGIIFQSSVASYADTTDLQDDSLAPQAGTYKSYLGAAGGGAFFRLGSTPDGQVTCDATQGATAANRTAGRLWEAVLDGPVGLTQSATNLVLQSENFGTAWVADGTPTRSAAAHTSSGVTLDLIGDNAAGAFEGYHQTVSFTGNAVKAISVHMKKGSSPATSGARVFLSDGTAAVNRVLADITWTAAGLPVINTSTGTSLGYETLTGGVYRLLFATTSVTASNVNVVYVLPAGSTGEQGDVYAGGVQAENATTPSVYTRTTTTTEQGGSWSNADVEDLDVADNSEIGYWAGPEDAGVLCSDVLELIANTVGAWWASDAKGVLRIKQLTDPASGTSNTSIAQNDLWENLTPLLSGDVNSGIPPYKTILRYAKNYAVQTSDLAGAVTDADRANYAREWREAVDEDSAIQDAHPLSQPVSIDTLYSVEADAEAEATRRQALLGAERTWYSIGLLMTSAYAAIELGDVITLTHARFGLSGGVKFKVLGIRPDAKPSSVSTITLTIWK